MQHVFYTKIAFYTISKTAKCSPTPSLSHPYEISLVDIFLSPPSFLPSYEKLGSPTSTSPLISFNICSRFSLLSTFTWCRKLQKRTSGGFFQHAEKNIKTTGGPLKKDVPQAYSYQKRKISKIMFFPFNKSNSNLTLHFSLPPLPQPTQLTTSTPLTWSGCRGAVLMATRMPVGLCTPAWTWEIQIHLGGTPSWIASCLGPGWCVNFEDWKLGDCWFTHPQLVRELIGVTKCLCTYVSV